jgi:hypothetical protein
MEDFAGWQGHRPICMASQVGKRVLLVNKGKTGRSGFLPFK